MTETEYWNHFKQISREIESALEVFHAAEEINRLAQENKEVRRLLEADARFWNIQVSSLQSSLFVILGRLFDSTKGTLSVARFLDETIEHPGYFSKEALMARRMAGGGPKPDWLNDRMAEAWVPNRASLNNLRDALKPHEEKAKLYRDIRHKHYAHRPPHDEGVVWQLFQQTNRNEISDMLGFLCALKSAIWHLYHDGTELNLDSSLHERYAEPIRQSVRSVFQRLTHGPIAD